MRIIQSGLVLGASHLFLVIIIFFMFGLGLEGRPNVGHELLWLLLKPGAWLTGPWFMILLLNSLVWGFACAVVFAGLRRFLRNNSTRPGS